MDYFQGVVVEYLRANRSVFVNTECLIQLDDIDKQLKDRHWFCDAMAVNFKESAVYLCEITFSVTMHSLLNRLQAWGSNWPELVHAVRRDAGVPSDWSIRPWVFIPQRHHDAFSSKLTQVARSTSGGTSGTMPTPRVTFLEAVLPWEYRSWDRKTDAIAGEA